MFFLFTTNDLREKGGSEKARNTLFIYSKYLFGYLPQTTRCGLAKQVSPALL